MLKHYAHVGLFSGEELTVNHWKTFFFFFNPMYETEIIDTSVWKEEVNDTVIVA